VLRGVKHPKEGPMIEAAQLRKGTVVEIDGELYRVFEFQHQKIGRGGANVKTKLRNLVTGSIAERTFNSDERLQDVRLESRRVQYLYTDGDLYHFMDVETFEQPVLSAAMIEDVKPYLVENMELQMSIHDGIAVEIELPTTVDLPVAETAPGYKGDTASGGGKPAKLSNGVTINVPFFIEAGDVVRVDTRTGSYVTRVREK
jgi:elongation factor P